MVEKTVEWMVLLLVDSMVLKMDDLKAVMWEKILANL